MRSQRQSESSVACQMSVRNRFVVALRGKRQLVHWNSCQVQAA